MARQPDYIRWFRDIGNDDIASVGGKNASLGEMYRELGGVGIRVPNGFAITAHAYRDLVAHAGGWQQLHAALDDLDVNDPVKVARAGQRCREVIYQAGIPDALRTQILAAHDTLLSEYGAELSVAVRSSATAEDLPTASFAGQHDTYLNIAGGESLIEAVRRCFASGFTNRAIRYRADQGFDHFKVYLSVGVMKMVRSDRAASGVIFTLDTDTGFRDVVFITGAHGLGENVVQGAVDPDEFYVHKPTFRQGHRTVLRHVLGAKKIKMVYGHGRDGTTIHNVPTSTMEREHYCIDDAEVLALADMAMTIEDHYSARAGCARPMDIEWAKDAGDGHLYVVQARPETVASQRSADTLVEYRISPPGSPLVSGRAVGERIASGVARVVSDRADLGDFRPGEVLVADATSPDWGAVLSQASAIVTNRGGRTCHAAIVARELNIPAVVGAGRATEQLETGQRVTVSCAEGTVGRVYAGEVPFDVLSTDVGTLPRPATRIMMNIGNPELAFKYAAIPNDGVGLARLEFIVSEYVKAHPMALLHRDKVTDVGERAALDELVRHFESPAAFFVQTLSEGVGMIAAAFYPKPVVVRLSDFKSNEYASLLGGADFEPNEENPMLGFRGASRYDHPNYREGFALECAAMKRVREDMGLVNVRLMVPFCRRVEEASTVIAAMSRHGLERGVNGLEIYAMCEIPNNVLLIDEFSEYFDGFSIGSNDLTQLTLGVDRDSELVAFDFDERDPGVKKMLQLSVEGAQRNGKHSGICGQAPSDYPEIAEYLVRLGIDSISLSPDTVLATTQRVLALEKGLGRRRECQLPEQETHP